MKKNKLALILICSGKLIFAQSNMIPNSGFEGGILGHNPQCTYVWDSRNIEADISYWQVATCKSIFSSCRYHKSSPDWMNNGCDPRYQTPSFTRFVFLQHLPPKDNADNREDAMRTGLLSSMSNSKNYFFRISYAEALNGGGGPQLSARIRVYFTKYGKNWSANWGNTKISFPMYPPNNWIQHWVVLQNLVMPTFPADQCKNIVLDCEQGAFMADYVELSEMCVDPLLIQNHVFYFGENEMPYTSGGILRAGNNVGSPTATGDVIVKNNAQETFKATTAIYLEPGFRTENNAHFEATIENCDTYDPNRIMPPVIQMLSKNEYMIITERDTISIQDDHVDTLTCHPDTLKINGLDGDTTSFTNYWWDYGNGITSTSKIAKILYTQPGNYLVRLALTDSTGFTDTLSKMYIVPDCANLRTDIKQSIINGTNSAMGISPNPNNGRFVLQLKNRNENDVNEIFIYNDLGKLVQHQFMNSSILQIDLSSQSKGMYFIRAQNADKVYTEKFVVE